MAGKGSQPEGAVDEATPSLSPALPLWQLGITEITGHNLEARGRVEVNRLLQEGWLLLEIYVLKYHEDGIWRERPMAILGRPRSTQEKKGGEELQQGLRYEIPHTNHSSKSGMARNS